MQLHENNQRIRVRDLCITVGVYDPGPLNAITDVDGVLVGHKTIIRGDRVRTGVTAVVPDSGNLMQQKVPAAIFVGNGFGKLAGYTQVEELGTIEAPIILTNTLAVGTAIDAIIKYTLSQPGNEDITSVNAVIGETNDSRLSDIRGMHVTEDDVIDTINDSKPGPVDEGCVGAGTGTTSFGFKSGIGTASRIITLDGPVQYTLGVLVQSNFGGLLEINGVPIGRILRERDESPTAGDESGGSCMIVVATDAPVTSRNLKRIAARTMHGLAKTGAYMSNGSGDYAIAFSTAYRIPHMSRVAYPVPDLLPNDTMTPFFRAAIEATQEAVYNSLFVATSMSGYRNQTFYALPVDEVLRIFGDREPS
jgi:D-aminopeptidase